MTERSAHGSPRFSPAPPFSAAARAAAWERLPEGEYDLLIVGGGITGVGAAWDAATRGLRVALVESGDLAQGTSSRSSRLVHGGLRYLETFHFHLVFEALAERRRLMQLAPHLVRPLPFLFPVYAGAAVGMLKLAAGMWAYDALALYKNIQSHRLLSRRAALRREPELRREGLRGAAVYYDAQVDDARLTLTVGRAAHEAGATLVTGAPVVAFLRSGDGPVEGVEVRDARTGRTTTIRAALTVVAVGPWTDALRRLLDPSAAPRLRPTKGVHIQLKGARVGNRGAITFRSPIDQRVMFVLPWGEFTYVGTTDTDYTGEAEEAEASAADVDYLLRSLNAIFPRAHATPGDVVSSWTGVRPLVSPEAAEGVTASQTSREHEIWREGGALFVAGGKLTTFRVMAQEVVDTAVDILGRERGTACGPSATATRPLPGAPGQEWGAFLGRICARAAALGVSRETAVHLAHVHGSGAEALLALIGDDPTLAAPVLAGHPFVWAEVIHAVRAEMALTLEDVMRRRLHLFYDAEDGGLSAAPQVAARMATEPALGWTAEETAAELERYAAAVAATRHRLEAPVSA